MIHLGQYNTLTILRDTEPGLFLGDEEDNDILLPNKYVPEHFEIGDEITVFAYLDSHERPVTTTLKPYINLNDFAMLRVTAVSDHGAFMDWGLEKDLFVPFKEQARPMQEGKWYLVYMYLDSITNRLVATNKIDRYTSNKELTVQEFDKVDLIVSRHTEIGTEVIINNKHKGLIYKNELFKEVHLGDRFKGIIKKIREDNKIDVSPQQEIGYRNIEPNAQTILDAVEDNNGYLALTDKSDPDDVKRQLQMSKKAFKKALGTLYKQQKINIKEDGIYLNEGGEE
jgi:hypothetical protein